MAYKPNKYGKQKSYYDRLKKTSNENFLGQDAEYIQGPFQKDVPDYIKDQMAKGETIGGRWGRVVSMGLYDSDHEKKAREFDRKYKNRELDSKHKVDTNYRYIKQEKPSGSGSKNTMTGLSDQLYPDQKWQNNKTKLLYHTLLNPDEMRETLKNDLIQKTKAAGVGQLFGDYEFDLLFPKDALKDHFKNVIQEIEDGQWDDQLDNYGTLARDQLLPPIYLKMLSQNGGDLTLPKHILENSNKYPMHTRAAMALRKLGETDKNLIENVYINRFANKETKNDQPTYNAPSLTDDQPAMPEANPAPVVKQPMLQKLASTLTATPAAAVNTVNQVGKEIKPITQPIQTAAATAGKAIVDTVNQVGKEIKPITQPIQTATTNVGKSVVNTINQVGKDIKPVSQPLQNVAKAAQQVVQQAPKKIEQAATSVVNAGKNLFKRKWR